MTSVRLKKFQEKKKKRSQEEETKLEQRNSNFLKKSKTVFLTYFILGQNI